MILSVMILSRSRPLRLWVFVISYTQYNNIIFGACQPLYYPSSVFFDQCAKDKTMLDTAGGMGYNLIERSKEVTEYE